MPAPTFPSQIISANFRGFLCPLIGECRAYRFRHVCWQGSFEDGSSIFAGVMTEITAILPETMGAKALVTRSMGQW